MGGKGHAPPAPDYTPLATAAQAQIAASQVVADSSGRAADQAFQLGQEQLAWAKEQQGRNDELIKGINDKQLAWSQDQFSQNNALIKSVSDQQMTFAKEQQAKNDALSQQVVDSAVRTQDANTAAAAADRKRYQDIYQPIEDKMAADALSYASPERKALEMGRASAQVATQFDAQRTAALQNLEGFGVDPSSTRYAALDIGTRAAQAAAQAAAANQTGQMVDATGRALQSEEVNVGRGYPGQVAGTYGTALAAGNQAINSGLAATASGANNLYGAGNSAVNAGLGLTASGVNSIFGAGNTAINSNLASTASGANTMGTAPGWSGLGIGALGTQAGAVNAGTGALGTWGNIINQGYANQVEAYKAQQSSSSGIGGILGGIAGAVISKWEDGGAIPTPDATPTPGGAIPVTSSVSRGAVSDDVHAMLTPGEFVVPKDVMQWKGEEFFQGLIAKSRENRQTSSPARGRPAPGARPGPTAFVSRPGMPQAIAARQ